jgi:hypothetical protein
VSGDTSWSIRPRQLRSGIDAMLAWSPAAASFARSTGGDGAACMGGTARMLRCLAAMNPRTSGATLSPSTHRRGREGARCGREQCAGARERCARRSRRGTAARPRCPAAAVVMPFAPRGATGARARCTSAPRARTRCRVRCTSAPARCTAAHVRYTSAPAMPRGSRAPSPTRVSPRSSTGTTKSTRPARRP